MNTPTLHLNHPNASAGDAAQALIAAGAMDVAASSPFKNCRIGSFELVFSQNDDLIKPKKSDGYVSLKLRGRSRAEVGYFIVESDSKLPDARALHRQIEQYFAKLKDAKVNQVHLEACLYTRSC